MDKYLPVFKHVRKDGLVSTTFFNALGVAVTAVTLVAVNDGLKRFQWKAYWRYPAAFASSFVAGAIAFLILWTLFGLGMPDDYLLKQDFGKKSRAEEEAIKSAR